MPPAAGTTLEAPRTQVEPGRSSERAQFEWPEMHAPAAELNVEFRAVSPHQVPKPEPAASIAAPAPYPQTGYRPTLMDRLSEASRTLNHYALTVTNDLLVGAALPMVGALFYQALLGGSSLGDKALVAMGAGACIGAAVGAARAFFTPESARS